MQQMTSLRGISLIFISILCLITGQEVVIGNENMISKLPLPYLAFMPTLLSQQDSATPALLRQLITSVEQSKSQNQVSSNCNQTKYGSDVKLEDIGGELKILIVSAANIDWFRAMQHCKALGLQLISLETEEKNLRVQAFMTSKGYHGYMWTSGIRLDNTWLWSAKNEIFTYKGWHSSQPDNGDEKCHLVKYTHWSDTLCNNPHAGYICEPST